MTTKTNLQIIARQGDTSAIAILLEHHLCYPYSFSSWFAENRLPCKKQMKVSRYLTLEEFCTCTQTYRKYAQDIDPYPKNPASLQALKELNYFIVDPIIDKFGRDNFCLTYGFCSIDLKRFLAKKDPLTGIKNGRVEPSLDQHMAQEVNRNGNYYCSRLGAACDFRITNVDSEAVVNWILATGLPFDSLYYYGVNRPIHISYGFQHKRDIWTFTTTGQPTRKGIEKWIR